ncbi:MAG: metallopeptidase domain-containing protein, partial [Planctomycetota bacterium]
DPRKELKVAVIFVGFADAPCDAEDWMKRVFEPVREYFKRESDRRLLLLPVTHTPVRADVERGDVASWRLGGKTEKEFLAPLYAATGTEWKKAIFILAGRPGKDRNRTLWPHQDRMKAGKRTVDYALTLSDMRGFDRGALAHEMGHLFALPDKYEDPDYSAGPWCLMGTGYRGEAGDEDHEPLRLCADCRARLGWTRVHPFDSAKKGSFVLEPPAKSRSALRLLLNRSGSESLLLEMRPAKGLLVWHVAESRTTAFLGRFPTKRTDRLTPYSEPAFRGRCVGSRPVYLTDIRFEDGRAWVTVGPEAELTALEKLRRSRMGKWIGGK